MVDDNDSDLKKSKTKISDDESINLNKNIKLNQINEKEIFNESEESVDSEKFDVSDEISTNESLDDFDEVLNKLKESNEKPHHDLNFFNFNNDSSLVSKFKEINHSKIPFLPILGIFVSIFLFIWGAIVLSNSSRRVIDSVASSENNVSGIVIIIIGVFLLISSLLLVFAKKTPFSDTFDMINNLESDNSNFIMDNNEFSVHVDEEHLTFTNNLNQSEDEKSDNSTSQIDEIDKLDKSLKSTDLEDLELKIADSEDNLDKYLFEDNNK